MVKVECDGCKAPYQIDEKRIPATGLKMRCPKCGTNLLVTKPGAAAPAGGGDADLPAPAAPKAKPGPPPPPRAAAPKPPPPPQAAAPAPAFGDVDFGMDPDLPKTRSGFGEIDLMVDLPAPGTDLSQEDLPAVAGGRPPGPFAMGPQAAPNPAPPFAAPPGRPQPPPPPGRKQAPPPPPQGAFGDVDLPAVAGPPAQESFGEVDFPMPAEAAALPAPVAPKAPRMRSRTVNFGDIDLPSVPMGADLPAPAYPQHAPHAAAPQSHGFGEIDLPLVADDGMGLPSPAHGHAGLPMAAEGAGLPMPAFGDIGLPMAAPGAGLPMAAPGAGLPMPAQGAGLPMPAQGAGLPTAAPGAGLPMPAQGTGLPMPAPGAGLPMTAQGTGYPMAAQGTGYPMPAQGTGYPMAQEAGLPMYGGEAPIGGEASFGRSSAFDDSDRAVPMQVDAGGGFGDSPGIDLAGAPREVGSEADLAADVGQVAPGATPGREAQRRPREAEAPAKKSNVKRAAIVGAVVVAVTGGAMSMVPAVGPFGIYLVSDKLNASSNAASLQELEKQVGAQLDEDTHAAVSAAMERCQASVKSMPRYKPAAGFCSYVALTRSLRFGRRSDDEAVAKQLREAAGDDGGDAATLASAALDVLAGQQAKARGPVNAIAQRAAQDLDAAVLAAYVELYAKADKDAVAAWKKAVSVKKTARTLFGLARAQEAAGDIKGALESAKAVLAASPQHASARTLIARLTWSDTAKEPEALSMLKQVTEGSVRKDAADSELVEAYTLLGNIHLGRSRMSAADQAFAAALKIDPLNMGALVGNGELFYRSGRYSEALARYEAATKADPESVLAKVGTAKTWIALERVKEAKDLLKKVRESKPKEPLVAVWLGRADEALGNKKDAESAYVEAIKIGENRLEVVEAYVALAHLLSGLGRTDDANAKLAEASKKFPDFPALHRAKGEVALTMGRYDEAKNELEAALAKEDDLGARFKLGVTMRRMRKFEEASAIFDKVAAVDKDYPGLAIERGLLFAETGQVDRALESYNEALKKAPNDVDLKLRVGSTQVMAGHPNEAEKILREVYKERPNSAEVNHFLGRALLLKGTNLAEAMRFLELAATLDSNRAEYHLYVGWAANELGQAAKAGPALNKALELDHELGDAYWQRGVLLQKQGSNKDALKDLMTALEKRPSRHEAWATIALCYQDLQRWPDAEQAWRKAIAGNDSVAEWHYRLGKLLSGHGRAPQAAPELERAIELAEKPDQPPYQWLYDAHFLAGEALKSNAAQKQKALEHFQRFIELAPKDHAYVTDAQKAIAALGGGGG
jgi:predicted Zn finger-like uncharacterized protein